ncbi:MAG: PaaX family transcriptional regulator [Actinomycetota bacterium]|jgi:phenylacetic acid degradation operon negative regulatory protein|nr:PaaX family transcriptional regulator [Actinomycetota bacterium]
MENVELTSAGSNPESIALRRPQSVMFSFLGIYLRGQSSAIYSGSVIDVFARMNISVDAVRSTLTRMVKRDLLNRHRHGRKMYFSVTDRGEKILNDGYARVWESGAVNRNWDGQWTVVAFSLPNDCRQERHDLRSRLIWRGFGLLQPGLWVAPGQVEVSDMIDEVGLAEYMSVMTARPATPTESSELVVRAFDLSSIANSYDRFLEGWDSSNPWLEWPDDLARQLILHTDWLQLVRQNPRLPADYLPTNWPAFRAEYIFQSLAQKFEPEAETIAASLFDMIEV